MHYFEFGFSYRQPMWHGLGAVIDERPNSYVDAMVQAGLDWSVSLRPVFARVGDKYILDTHHNATVRSSDNQVLGIVSPQYEIIQNSTMFKFAQSLTELKESTVFETAGSLKEGSVVFCLMNLEELDFLLQDDERELHKTYMCITSSHDGTAAMRVFLTNVRVVCWNTLSSAIGNAQATYSVRHIGDTKSMLDECRNVLNVSIKWSYEVSEMLQSLSDITFTSGDFQDMVETIVFPEPDIDATERQFSLWESSVSKLVNRYEELNDSGSSIAETQAMALNTITEYLDYGFKGFTQEGSFLRVMNPNINKQKASVFNYLLSY